MYHLNDTNSSYTNGTMDGAELEELDDTYEEANNGTQTIVSNKLSNDQSKPISSTPASISAGGRNKIKQNPISAYVNSQSNTFKSNKSSSSSSSQ